MAAVFKQKSNPIVAFSFLGLIAISQLLVFNAGYNVPMYFLLTLAVLCTIIIWSMLDTKCIIEEDILKSKVGPFVQKIKIENISEIKSSDFRKAGSRKRTEKLSLIYNAGKKLDFSPIDKSEFLQTLKRINPKIKLNLGKEIE